MANDGSSEKKKDSILGALKNMDESEWEEWTEGSHITKVSKASSKSDQETEGIKIRTGSYRNGGMVASHKVGMWLPKWLHFNEWLRRLFTAVKKLVPSSWSQKLDDPYVELDGLKQKVVIQEDQLTRLLEELNESKRDKEILERDLELAKSISYDEISTYEEKLKEISALVDEIHEEDQRKEEEIKNKLKANPWIFGIDCKVNATNRDIDSKYQLDMHIETNFNEQRIFELKSPNLKPFQKDKKTSILKPTKHFSDAINQLITYMEKTDLYKKIKSDSNYSIASPIGVVLMGYKLDVDSQELLQYWNKRLYPNIKIITYNDLFISANRTVDMIKKASNKSRETSSKIDR